LLGAVNSRAQPPPLRAGNLVMHFGLRPYLMGIVNVTPDSFSDGGRFFDRQRAVEHALALVEQGADILDIGGESTRPGSDPVPASAEIDRVVPVIEDVVRWAATPISIDTTKAAVARAALDAGATLVNDVSALRFDPEMAGTVAAAGVPLVLMHMRGTPKTMQQGQIVYGDLLGEIAGFLAGRIQQARQAGIAAERIIVDPGIGFGKTAEHNLSIIHRLGELAALGRPVLLGVSRKAFIGQVLDVPVEQRVFGTAAAVAAGVLAGAHIIRVHDVAPMRQVALLAQAIANESLPAAPGRASGERP